MKRKALTFAGLCAITAALAIPATGTADPGATIYAGRFVLPPGPFNMCGIDGTGSLTLTGVTKFDADGAILRGGDTVLSFTSAATGKTIEWQTAGTEQYTTMVDNGDGSVTFTVHAAGINFRVFQPQGPPQQVLAGERDVLITANYTTGDETDVTLHSAGSPFGLPDCGPILAALG